MSRLKLVADKDKPRELAASIQREGLIEPIIVRPKSDRYEMIAGERRLRAVRDFTEMEIVDAELIEDIEYLSMGKTPADRVKTLLAKLDSVRSSQERGSEVSSQSKALFHKFVEQVDQIFQNLPKSLEWRSFYTHDLTLIVDICKEVQDISIVY